MSIRFDTPGLSAARTTSRPESVTADSELLDDRRRLIEHVHRALLAAAGGRHLAVGELEVHDPRANRRIAALRHDQDLAVTGIEPFGDVSHQLDVLALVVADGHLVGAVGQHVRRHQHRIREQTDGHELALDARLLLELMHSPEVAVGGHARQQPAQLGVLEHVALAEEDAALRVQTGRQQDRRGVVHRLAQPRRVVGDGGRVQVDDAVDPLAALLPGHVLRDRADVVAEVLAAGGLNAGEDPHSRQATGSGAAERAALRPRGLRSGLDGRQRGARCGPPAIGESPGGEHPRDRAAGVCLP